MDVSPPKTPGKQQPKTKKSKKQEHFVALLCYPPHKVERQKKSNKQRLRGCLAHKGTKKNEGILFNEKGVHK